MVCLHVCSHVMPFIIINPLLHYTYIYDTSSEEHAISVSDVVSPQPAVSNPQVYKPQSRTGGPCRSMAGIVSEPAARVWFLALPYTCMHAHKHTHTRTRTSHIHARTHLKLQAPHTLALWYTHACTITLTNACTHTHTLHRRTYTGVLVP